MTDSTLSTKQRMFKAKILPQLKNFTRAALATLMTFSLSAHDPHKLAMNCAIMEYKHLQLCYHGIQTVTTIFFYI